MTPEALHHQAAGESDHKADRRQLEITDYKPTRTNMQRYPHRTIYRSGKAIYPDCYCFKQHQVLCANARYSTLLIYLQGTLYVCQPVCAPVAPAIARNFFSVTWKTVAVPITITDVAIQNMPAFVSFAIHQVISTR